MYFARLIRLRSPPSSSPSSLLGVLAELGDNGGVSIILLVTDFPVKEDWS
jgi:hypothetical protein